MHLQNTAAIRQLNWVLSDIEVDEQEYAMRN